MSNSSDKLYTRYIVARNSVGSVTSLYRFEENEALFSMAHLQNGQWIKDNSLYSVLCSLHNPYYDEISDEEAAQIAAPHGVIIPVKQYGDVT